MASIIALVVLLPTILQAATFTVTSTAAAVDASPDGGVCATAGEND